MIGRRNLLLKWGGVSHLNKRLLPRYLLGVEGPESGMICFHKGSLYPSIAKNHADRGLNCKFLPFLVAKKKNRVGKSQK